MGPLQISLFKATMCHRFSIISTLAIPKSEIVHRRYMHNIYIIYYTYVSSNFLQVIPSQICIYIHIYIYIIRGVSHGTFPNLWMSFP